MVFTNWISELIYAARIILSSWSALISCIICIESYASYIASYPGFFLPRVPCSSISGQEKPGYEAATLCCISKNTSQFGVPRHATIYFILCLPCYVSQTIFAHLLPGCLYSWECSWIYVCIYIILL